MDIINLPSAFGVCQTCEIVFIVDDINIFITLRAVGLDRYM
jgi:hypothetical protein